MINGLSKRLQTARLNLELTRKQAAELIGVTESTIGLYESSNRQPSLTNLVKLASIYKVTTDYLLGCEPVDKSNLSSYGLTNKQMEALHSFIKAMKNE